MNADRPTSLRRAGSRSALRRGDGETRSRSSRGLRRIPRREPVPKAVGYLAGTARRRSRREAHPQRARSAHTPPTGCDPPHPGIRTGPQRGSLPEPAAFHDEAGSADGHEPRRGNRPPAPAVWLNGTSREVRSGSVCAGMGGNHVRRRAGSSRGVRPFTARRPDELGRRPRPNLSSRGTVNARLTAAATSVGGLGR
jgi:hypothetical protein